jgi:hypothetical protein
MGSAAMMKRHRIPTIFNIYMIDALCCALGCIIFVWLLNLRDARDRAEAVSQTTQQLARARAELDDLTQKEAAARERLADTEDDLATARGRVSALDKALAALLAEKTAGEERLAKQTKEQQALSKDLAAARLRVENLETQVKDGETLARVSAKNLVGLNAQLRDMEARANLVPGLRDKVAAAEARMVLLEKDVGERKRELAGVSRSKEDLEKANERLLLELAARSKDMTESDNRLIALRDEKKSLLEQIARVRAAAENRFAGIELTGRRVVFLVDVSGSMDLTDERTPAPGKWAGVRETLARILRSLPGLEKYQVIAFSDKVSFPIGSAGQWVDFDPRTSVDQALTALDSVKPKGGTNMYDAFEAAFRLRPVGLDTIYLLSDGLPNMGAGITAEESAALQPLERAGALGKHVRRTLVNDWNRTTATRARVRVNTVGFFYESPDVGAFLWALARENDGSFVGMSKP